MIDIICSHETENGTIDLRHRVNINGVEIWTVFLNHKNPSIGTKILNYVFHEQAINSYKENLLLLDRI